MRKKSSRGNALIEYALPAAVILLTCGVIGSLTGVNDLMADYFMSASGKTRSKLDAGTKTFKVDLTTSEKLGAGGDGSAKVQDSVVGIAAQGTTLGMTSAQQLAMNQSTTWLGLTDGNHDGKSQLGEYLNQWLPATGGSYADGQKAFNRVDMNNDGVLDANEIAADYEAYNASGLDVPTYNRRLVYDNSILNDMKDSYRGFKDLDG